MGFHIVNLKDKKIEHIYVETQDKLAELDNITEDSIIYQGEKHWIPVRVGSDKRYENYSKDWYRAGIKAQELFKKQAKEKQIILEELNQDVKSFKPYFVCKKFIPIKRGDYLIRNFGNIEVDVKCRTFYDTNNGKVFNFKCEDVEKHLNMQDFTKTPILIAVYKRIKDTVVEDTPHFISINTIKSNESSLEKEYIYKENTGWCFRIPLNLTSQTFAYIKEIYNQGSKSKSYTYKEERVSHPNAYKKWTTDEDELLEKLYCEQASTKSLCDAFGRNQGAIINRIEKLELKVKYGKFPPK